MFLIFDNESFLQDYFLTHVFCINATQKVTLLSYLLARKLKRKQLSCSVSAQVKTLTLFVDLFIPKFTGEKNFYTLRGCVRMYLNVTPVQIFPGSNSCLLVIGNRRKYWKFIKVPVIRIWNHKCEFLASTREGHVPNSMSINQKRLAEVWLDDYKNIVYLRHPELKTLEAGNITDRVNLRHRLNCSSFDWYMKNVHPDKHVPTLKVKAMNGLMTAHNSCVDTMQIDFGPGKIYPYCHYTNSQNYQLTEFDQGCITVS